MSPLLHAQVHAFGLQVLRMGLWLVILTVIFVPLEQLFALRRKPGRLRDVPADLAYFVLNSLLPLTILAPPMALLAAGVAAVTPRAYAEAMAALPFGVRLALALAVSEVGGYWGHRWSHEFPLLWRFHAVHHAPDHVDWLVSSRAHPVDQVFTKLCALTPLYLLGLVQPTPQGAGLAAWIPIFGIIWGFFVHANLRWRLGPLEALVSTPAFHHWHHTQDEHRDHNYAALFPVVDRLFASHHLPRHWPSSYGVDQPQPATMAEQILRPLGFGGRQSAPSARGEPTV